MIFTGKGIITSLHLIFLNSIAKEELSKRKGLKADIVDNYFDFDSATSKKADKLKEELNVEEDELIVLHATRIVKRKAIEFALNFCAYLNKEIESGKIKPFKKIRMIFPGLIEDLPYYKKLLKLINTLSLNVEFQSGLCGTYGKRPYTLWDFYEISDLVTYTSILEGWGNQFIEALAFKKLLVLYEYPVFERDIKRYNFEYISLGNSYNLKNGFLSLEPANYQQAVQKTIAILSDKKEYNRVVAKNYEIAYKNFSIQALSKKLKDMFQKVNL